MAELLDKSAVNTVFLIGLNYHWKVKYGGIKASDIKLQKELEEENRRLQHMNAE